MRNRLDQRGTVHPGSVWDAVRDLFAGALAALAAIAEGLFAWAVTGDGVVLAAALHLVAAAGAFAFTLLLLGHAPPPARVQAGWVAVLLVLCMPIAGLLGVLSTVLPAWCRRARAAGPKWVELPLPEYAGHAKLARVCSPPARHSLSDAEVEQRVAALRTLRRVPPERSTPLIRHALTDPSEDVRLLAFALLEQGERAIRQRLERNAARLAALTSKGGEERRRVEPRRIAALRLALARDYFDLVHGQFVMGGAANAVLDLVVEHAAGACRAGWEGPAALLEARVHLRRRQIEAARAALLRAALASVPAAVLAPLWAEWFYLQRRFDEVAASLACLSAVSARRAVLGPVVAHWRARRSA